MLNEHLGWVTVTHPFHPLHGQQFAVLKERLVGSVPTVVLRGSSQGTFAVPCEWTSRSVPFDRPTVFDAAKLLRLSELIAEVSTSKCKKEVDK